MSPRPRVSFVDASVSVHPPSFRPMDEDDGGSAGGYFVCVYSMIMFQVLGFCLLRASPLVFIAHFNLL